MDLPEALRRRRMVRSFTGQPVDAGVLGDLLDGARRAPTAGHSQGTSFVVLVGPAETERYWSASLPSAPARERFAFPGLLRAPVLVVVLTSPDEYVARYAEADKRATGLGADIGSWPVPYWFVDGGMAVMALLLGAVAADLGACFFGLFENEADVLAALGVPEGWRAVGTVAFGQPADDDRPGRSAGRPRRPFDEVVHFGGWRLGVW